MFSGDDLQSNKDLRDLVENFRNQASELVDMLDISIPVVAKLKVCVSALYIYIVTNATEILYNSSAFFF